MVFFSLLHLEVGYLFKKIIYSVGIQVLNCGHFQIVLHCSMFF